MPTIVFCIGNENLDWMAEKYVRVSDKVNGVKNLAHKLLEVFKTLDGNERVKQVLTEELEKAGRRDLADLLRELLD